MSVQGAHLYAAIPELTMDSLRTYAQDHVPTGDFLRAVLENNLVEAMGRADPFNRAALFAICAYVYNEMPGTCWGSPEKVSAWLAARLKAKGEEVTP